MRGRRSIASRCGSTRWRRLHCRSTRRTGSGQRLSGGRFPRQSIARTWAAWYFADTRSQPWGRFSPANKFWFNSKLKADSYAPDAALKMLQGDGFRLENGVLKDKGGNGGVFSIITNSGNKYRERMATMIQEDLHKIGIQVNVVTLDFPSLIERMTQTFDYEAILLGLTNVGLDPNEQMNVWLSSSENHQWNPQEKAPETAWEAEIDRLMRAQASSADSRKRKESFDRVQEIAVEQSPFIYLVNRNALSAVAATVQGVSPVVQVPQTYWNVDRLSLSKSTSLARGGTEAHRGETH